MKDTFDILDNLFPLVNIATITTLIDGRVFRNRKPINLKTQDIVLVPLAANNGEPIQQSTVFVNCFAKNHDNGLSDEATLRTVAGAVISALEAGSASTSYFDVDIVSQALIRDIDDPDMSYVSIRTICTIAK